MELKEPVKVKFFSSPDAKLKKFCAVVGCRSTAPDEVARALLSECYASGDMDAARPGSRFSVIPFSYYASAVAGVIFECIAELGGGLVACAGVVALDVKKLDELRSKKSVQSFD
ncbi:MAG: hypothetical protein ABIK73_06230 [candidate division WOR-3 bacterium]